MWAENMPNEWIKQILEHCSKYDNRYLFQTKNPKNIRRILVPKSYVCVTLETNRYYHEIMQNCPTPDQRIKEMEFIRHPLYITIEPIIDFDLNNFIKSIKACNPIQVNIGADSGNNNLTEPSKEKVLELIEGLNEFTKVVQKKNLKRIL